MSLLAKLINQDLRKLFYILFVFTAYIAFSQSSSNIRIKNITLNSDTIKIDTLSLAENGFVISFADGKKVDTLLYKIDYARAEIITSKELRNKSIRITYRVLPIDFSKNYYHKDYELVTKAGIINKPVSFNRVNHTSDKDDFFNSNELKKNGNISRGVSVGNNQNAVMSSSLNLQLAGKISDDLSILAAISDDNIPIQPDGNSQQIREFDKVFITVYNENSKLTVGDFVINKPTGYFLNYNKKLQGGSFETNQKLKNNNVFSTQVSGAVAKGKYNRMQFSGIEGNQGPYRLQGAENETYIIVLSGSEKVYIDGKLLIRGQDNDYVINYNTGEITFTPKQPITKDRRIIIEFEYSDKNYNRFLFQNSNEFKTKNANFYLNLYSEADNKNMPVNQSLSENEKYILSTIGDSLQDALVPNVDSIGYIPDEVLYKKIDTLAYNDVFVYSSSPDSAIYRVGFAYVGENRGNYIKTQSSVNGKTYKWIAPVSGVSMGDYEPVKVLITPKKRQMMTMGGDIRINKNLRTNFEFAVSNNDINTFSDKDNANNDGYAFKFGLEKDTYFKDTTSKITTSFNYDYLNKDFTPIERFKTSEYNRDWNISGISFNNEEHLLDFNLNYSKLKLGNIGYTFSFLNRDTDFTGLKNSFNTTLRKKGFLLDFTGSLLNTDDKITNTEFLRYYGTLSKEFKILTFGVHLEQEKNLKNTDTSSVLNNTSFDYLQWEFFVNNSDTNNAKYFAKYIHRDDYKPYYSDLRYTTRAENVQAGVDFFKNRKNTLKTLVNFRKLDIIDSLLTTNKSENSVLARIEHSLRLFKGSVTSLIFYETGTGLEEKREYSYLKVAAGQGIYTWIDHNGNGIQDLDEFEVAIFQDEAEYIRIYTPTNEYIKVYTNQFSHTINLNPKRVWFNKKGIKQFASKFNNQLAYKLNSKTVSDDFLANINPFQQNTDSSSINIGNSLRNTFSFNRTAKIWGLDYIVNSVNNRVLTVNGLDSRYNGSNGLRLRISPIIGITFTNFASLGEKKYSSEFFASKNFNINYITNESQLSFQPNVKYRISFIYKHSQKQNTLGFEKSMTNDIGLEFRFNVVNKGNLTSKINYIKIDYNDNTSTPVAYEMLEGLYPGNNGTWSVLYQRNLSDYLQLTLNYTGRVSEDMPVIHTGTVQLRAFF